MLRRDARGQPPCRNETVPVYRAVASGDDAGAFAARRRRQSCPLGLRDAASRRRVPAIASASVRLPRAASSLRWISSFSATQSKPLLAFIRQPPVLILGAREDTRAAVQARLPDGSSPILRARSNISSTV